MGAAAELRIEVELTDDVWTDITADTYAPDGVQIRYGIQGNRPLDLVAGTGECAFTLRNHAANSGSQQGYYSPLHGSVRAGWTVGVGCRAVFHRTSDAAASVTSITRSGSTATVTETAHGRATDDWVTIAGANETEYNGTFQITNTGANTYTYTVAYAPVSPATGTLTARTAYIKHRGKVRLIDPEAGQYGSQLVRVVSYDGMRDLAEAAVREVSLQTSKTEAELLTAITDSLPAAAQPLKADYDTGVDTYPYAFDELGGGAKAMSVIQDIARSAFALVFMKGDGTLRLQSRNTRATGASAHTFTDTSLHGAGVIVPADVDLLRNLVRVTIRPRTVDAAATTVVYSSVGTPISVAAGETVTVWAEFRDPDETRTLIGAQDVVTPLLAGTDYAGNSQEDGGGSDLTADITPTVTVFASTAKIAIANTGASTVFLVDGSGNSFLQIRGKGVYDLGPQTFEASSVQDYGVKPLDVDLKYQSNTSTAQSYADYLEAQYSSLIAQLSAMEFFANDTDALLLQALAREPGDVITLTEPVTGVSAVDAVIHSVDLDIQDGVMITCRYGLAPAAPFQAWLLGVVGRGELGTATRLGF